MINFLTTYETYINFICAIFITIGMLTSERSNESNIDKLDVIVSVLFIAAYTLLGLNVVVNIIEKGL